jgi:hypothetical protein
MLPVIRGILPRNTIRVRAPEKVDLSRIRANLSGIMPARAGRMPALPSYAAAVSFGSSMVPLNFGGSSSIPKLSE